VYGAASDSGQSLKNLFRIAGASLMVSAVIYVWAFMAEFLLPVPILSSADAALQFIAVYRTYFVLSYALFTAANSLSIVGAFGIYAATRSQGRSYVILGVGTLIIGLVATLMSSTAPALIALSDGYSMSASAAEQQAFVAAALAVSAANNPLVASAFIGVGVIFVSLAMMAGSFGRRLGYLGLVVGTLNIVRALPFISAYPFLTGVIFVSVSSVWIFAVGRSVYKEARVSEEPREALSHP
jgi:hypothetical protein